MSLVCIDVPAPPLPVLAGARLHACRFQHGQVAVTGYDAGPFGHLDLPPALASAVPGRQAEYLAGRYCVRRAEHTLHGRYSHIASGADRAPIWPPGLHGSLSHAGGYALAIVSASQSGYLLGIDVENLAREPEPEGVQRQIASREEMALLEPVLDAAGAFSLMFSAKEAIYKALYPRARRFIDFHEVACVEAGAGGLLFETRDTLHGVLPRDLHLSVAFALQDERVFTLCQVELGVIQG
ncbi:4'-phosphopantetheinyl transferase family protein [Pseudomonas gingeri]|uniref:4'-phosphopantetheinyl transferase family protein n=1 Tax=Pseudomonas gingeri TaxID=117681 RepID=UPI0015A3B48E|nr:4'-phosphopantetheinyl transferase superfamily protein [Pseudomonas gingeri]NWE29376.1 4'-phosphopantetheinyl transferase superfamily protein [Pseudomonas gingeri]NWE98694.1 4'-phosphopantetheinyl transferase superfamily protein [Pseudomonas gingeri]